MLESVRETSLRDESSGDKLPADSFFAFIAFFKYSAPSPRIPSGLLSYHSVLKHIQVKYQNNIY
jgi:hypothetical protein